jgi:hypothetical protein
MAVSTAGNGTNIHFNQYSERLRSVEEIKPQITDCATITTATEHFSQTLLAEEIQGDNILNMLLCEKL